MRFSPVDKQPEVLTNVAVLFAKYLQLPPTLYLKTAGKTIEMRDIGAQYQATDQRIE